jgi:hypothetical protein
MEMPYIITADIRITTDNFVLMSVMQLRNSKLAACNLIMAVAIAVVGFPGAIATFQRLPAAAAVNALRSGQPVGTVDREKCIAVLARSSHMSNASRDDLAIALLAPAAGKSFDVAATDARRAAALLQRYLSSAPADSIAWSNLALARLRSGAVDASVAPFKMAMLMASSSGALLWRCGFGLAVFPRLDDEGREMLARQFDHAMKKFPREFVELVRQRKDNLSIVRQSLAKYPETLGDFESDFTLKN